MRIAVLGPLEVTNDDGRPIVVSGGKERLLLAVLAAAAPAVVSTDLIVESLWNGNRPAAARKSLQVHLVHLRNALEPDRPAGSSGRYVVRRGAGYALAAGREDVDSLRVADLAARGRARLAAGDPVEAVGLLVTALDLWRGEPYGDWPDAPFAEPERRRLAEVRTAAVTALLEARLALGEHADVVAEAERLLVENPLQEEWWRQLAVALYRSGRQGDALAALARARAVLADELGADPGPRLRAVEAAVLAQDPELDAPEPGGAGPVPRPPSDVTACPYKGLAAYQRADAELFHGRTRVVTSLVARLVDASLVVVSGASGAGKSSLVRAGLVPALAAGALPGSAAWRAVVLTPGRRPVDALAAMTGPVPPDSPVLLVCDQMEELWAPGVDRAERTAFLDTVLGLIEDGIVVRCVAVLRGDHVGRLAEHAAFTERLGGALMLVPALTDGELREVVNGPAAAVGLTAEAELLDAVVADLAGRPATLPLLSTALVGTWERRRGDRLTLAGYLEAGGVTGALARSAEVAYAALDDVGREAARRLLVRLADTDAGGALVRRPLPLADLDLSDETRRAVVDAFVGRRLLTLDGVVLDIAHEALLTAWPRLARWLEDDAAGRAVRRQLAPAAQEWSRRGEPDDELFRGARLSAAIDWAAESLGDLTTLERRFLDASKAQSDAELTEVRGRLHREAAARKRTRRLAVGLAAVLVVALVATGLAVRAQLAAERQSLVADGNRLAALSTTVGSLDLSFLLAAQGFRLADTPETQQQMLAVLAEHGRVMRAVPFPRNAPEVTVGNGGRTLFLGGGPTIMSWAVESEDLPGVVRAETAFDAWWSADASPTESVMFSSGGGEPDAWLRLVDDHGVARQVLKGSAVGGRPVGVSYTPDGAQVTVVVARGQSPYVPASWRVVQFDTETWTPRETGIGGTFPGLGVEAVSISDDAAVVVLWSADPSIPATEVDLVTGGQALLLPGSPHRGRAGYRAMPSGAAQMWDDGTVTLHDRSGRVVQELTAHRAPVHDVVLAPDASWGATADEDGDVVLWQVDPGTGQWSQQESLTGHGGAVVDIEADGSRRLVTLSADRTVIVWDVAFDGGFGTAHGSIPGRWVANAPDVVEPGRVVVVPTRPLDPAGQTIPYLGGGTLGVAATFLDVRTGQVVEEVPVSDTLDTAFFGASVAVSPDRRLVAVTSGLATSIVDARTHQVIHRIPLPPNGPPRQDSRHLSAGLVCCAVWTSDGSRLLLGTGGDLPGRTIDVVGSQPTGVIVVVDTATWEIADEVAVDVVPEVMELGPGGRWLAVAGAQSDEVLVLDTDTLGLQHRVALRTKDSLWSLSVSPDGRLLAGSGESSNLQVIDTQTWEAREPVPLRQEPTLQVEWLSDSRTVVSTGWDGTAVLFDVERALVRTAPLAASVDRARGYAHLVPDPDEEIVLLNDDHVAWRYPTGPGALLQDVCAVVGRDLTQAEWDRYLPGRPYRATCTDLD